MFFGFDGFTCVGYDWCIPNLSVVESTLLKTLATHPCNLAIYQTKLQIDSDEVAFGHPSQPGSGSQFFFF